MQIRTERTIISPLSKSDFAEIMMMYKEPDSNLFIPPLLNQSDEFYLQFLSGKVETNRTNLGFWTVRRLHSNELIGTVNLNIFKETEITHIGSHLSRKFWNKGYSTELMTALIDYGFNERNYEFIHGIVSSDHIVSKKLLEKFGFKFLKELDTGGGFAELYRLEPK